MAVDNNVFCYTVIERIANIRQDTIDVDQGLVAFLASAQNKGASYYSFNSLSRLSDGMNATERFRYIQRRGIGAYDSPVTATYCDPGVTRGYFQQEIEHDQEMLMIPLTFDHAEIRDFCEGLNNEIAVRLSNEMNALRSAWNAKIWARLVAGSYIGDFANGVGAGKTVPLFHTSVASPVNRINSTGETIMNRDMTDAGLAGRRPIPIGAGLLRDYAYLKNIACCNDAGFNDSMLSEIKGYIVDSTAETALGTNEFLTVVPGALQLRTAPQNVGEFERINDKDFTRTTLPDSLLPGIMWDLYSREINCQEGYESSFNTKVTLQLRLMWNLVGLPTDYYESGDRLQGVKDVFHYEAACSDETVCDIIS